MAQKRYPNTRLGFCFIKGVSLIDLARNSICRTMLDEGWDYLWFVDDDTIPPLDALYKMLELDKDVVIPAIPSRKHGDNRLCLFDSEDTTKPLTEFKRTRKIKSGGMACTLIKRKVIEEIGKKYGAPFKFENVDDIEYHEDTNFCRRANELGFEIWGIADVSPIHMGSPVAYFYDGGFKEVILEGA